VALALGTIIIFMNYLGALLPGSPSNVWLLVGLGCLLVGIIAATQYH
jgi:amino acid transporter